MAYPRLPMRKIREALRLKYACGQSERRIAESCGMARSTVNDYLRRAEQAGLSWPLPAEIDNEAKLGSLLFKAERINKPERTPPDCRRIYDELRRYKKFNLTLTELWLEYKDAHPDGYQYTQFCRLYKQWRGRLDYCMRQEHRAGEKVFVDYCDGLSIVDAKTGEVVPTQLFVAVWGASNFTYAEASLSQSLPCWIGSHARAFDYFGCVPKITVVDNLKSGVETACRYEPELNPSYAAMAEHYGTAVIPARPRRPRDKAKAEAGVLVAQRMILAVLRHRTFYSVGELNVAVRELLERLNGRLLCRMKVSRRHLFETMDRPAALPLPARAYEYAEWKKAAVNIDYHIEVDGHYYSVPFALVRQSLDVRLSAGTVEVFLKGERVAAHARSCQKHGHTTLPEHMPPEHRKYAEWTPSRIIDWAGKTGPRTARLVEEILASRKFPEQGYRACLGILRLGRHYGQERLEAACARALRFRAASYKSVRAILAANLDRVGDGPGAVQETLPLHDNIRGGQYYQ